jgi:hypothetical protein
VELLVGALGRGGAGTGPIEAFDQKMLARQGLDQPIIAVRARNIGRLPVDVTGWDVKTGAGFGYTLPGWEVNPSFPYRLEPGAQVTFFCRPSRWWPARPGAAVALTSIPAAGWVTAARYATMMGLSLRRAAIVSQSRLRWSRTIWGGVRAIHWFSEKSA